MTIGTIATPDGSFGAALTPAGLGRLTFTTESLDECVAWAQRWLPHARLTHDDRRLDELAEQLTAYFAGRLRTFTIPLDLRGTPFQVRVWRALLNVQYGEVQTYGAIAAMIDAPRAARAVGAANGANPIPIIVPCHRLVGSDGTLVRYGGGLDLKYRLLELEGASGWRSRMRTAAPKR